MLALAGSAFGKIGETPEQVIARSKRNAWGDIIGIQADNWQNNPLVHVHYRDGAIVTHIFGVSGRQIAMFSYAPKGFTAKDVAEIQGLYRTTWRGTGTEDGLFSWESTSGLGMTAKRYVGYDFVTIVDLSKKAELSDYAQWLKRELDFRPELAPSKGEPQDCLLVATEAYARLKNTAYWVKIAKFVITKDGKVVGGHAALFFQPTQNSNVFMYDRDEGSSDLHTQSHDPLTLELALQNVYGNGYAARSVGWIENQ